MNNDPLDEWGALYRQSAREQSAPSVDARILAAAELATRRRRPPAWSIGLATAAALLLMLAMHLYNPRPGNEPVAHATAATVSDDGTAAYLMQMDVGHPTSPVAQYLMSDDPQIH
jgi:predicted naringenin-chalcone synthase